MGFKLKKAISLKKIFEDLDLPWVNDKDYIIDEVSSIDRYVQGSLSFCNKNIEVPFDAILITDQDINSQNSIKNISPRTTFIKVLDWLYTNIGFDLYENESEIDPTASIGQNVVIETGCIIGKNVIIEPNVVVHKGTVIGDNSRIRSCASIGSDGFGFERLSDDEILRFPHLGRVVIGKNVEIGSCAAIARGTLSDTVIHDNVKIDNLVHIAHNVTIHKGAFVIAGAEVSGSVEIGKNAWIAPNACINQKLRIGEASLVGLGAVVTKNVEARTVVAGNPAKKIRML